MTEVTSATGAGSAVGSDRMRVTVAGLGNMGAALARALVRGRCRVAVWNRTFSKAEKLGAEGAVPVADLREAVRASDVVVACVSTCETVAALFKPLRRELAGRIFVNLTTGTPGEVRSIAAWAAQNGIAYLSGTIMATPSLIGRPETLIFYGGDQGAFNACRRILASFGGRAEYLGADPGLASLYDLALLTMLYGAWYGHLHAHALLQKAGVSAMEVLPFVKEWVEFVVAPNLTDPAEAAALDRRDYRTEESNLAVNEWAIELIIRASREAGVSAEWLVPIHRLASAKLQEGYGADSFTRVFDGILEQPVR